MDFSILSAIVTVFVSGSLLGALGGYVVARLDPRRGKHS